VALAMLLTLSAAGPAHAMQLTPLQKVDMKQHYEKATRAYDVQKYGEAVDEYQKAYEIGGDPAMLYNVAQSYRLADQLPDALRFYRRYLQRSPNARNREDVERKITELERTVEDRRRAAAQAAPVVVAAPAVPVSQTPVPPLVRDEGGGGARVAGIVLASVGAAALITAGITGKLASDKADKITQGSKTMATFDPNLEKNGKTLNTVTIASAIAGGALAVTGVVLIVMSGGGGPEQSATHAFVSPLFGGGVTGAVATLRF
jgi:tetratricopeptide (TPR) repeat protein